ncbi:globin domain-containing protein [Kitasatospora sp. NPDC059571]|uniref:globin domain-containing protein n=1 Tax=Kitasatospora sp. NPDC059571 TaxID=3346871 RepID=UPI00368D018B
MKARPLRVRAGAGATGPAAVPGLPPASASASASSPGTPGQSVREQPGPAGPPAAALDAGPVPAGAADDAPDPPPGAPEAVPGGPAAGASGRSAEETPAVPIPERPSVPPRIPAPSRPDDAPGAADGPAPLPRPLFTAAPGLNWTGPGDSWTHAWASGGAAQEPSRPALPARTSVLPPGAAPDPADMPPTPRDVELIRASLAVVEPVADRATAHFYALIFVHHPEVRALFPAAMDVQRDRLFRALLTAARNAHDPAALTEYLAALGRGHRKYGTLAGHYGPVGECLVAALAKYAGNRWDAATELAWRRVYGLVSRIMVDAAEEAAQGSPAWWQAEVVAREQSTPDVAVLTLRPDQPYPYRAGQYASVETPWWPRVWRHFSFGCAPRPDGLLTFHVKAVQAGWVSTALVRRAAPGDVLRLGPAAGGMTADRARGNGLLCLGGGTGIAPITALVEEIAESGADGRRVQVYYGARQASELYGLPALRTLADRHRWLTVHPVVSDRRVAPGEALAGELPEVVARYAPWHGHDAFLSGPPAMVRRGTALLQQAGVPADRIHHDLVGDLAAG